MAKVGAHKRAKGETPRSNLSDFDRELADLNAALARLEASVVLPEPREKSETETPKHQVKAKAGPPPPPAPADSQPSAPVGAKNEPSVIPGPSVPAGSASAGPTAPPVVPTGTDLNDPKNFGMMPPTADLEPGTASEEEYRQRLGRHLAFATTVLHTSKVPAAVWREWRAFEKAIQQRLHELANRPVDPAL